ncbi:MAG: exodeoxyribonuclease VII large subunit [Lachnospiraceae bacterium]|nr:exodeoxyribonuclease VII large subunit [Lachnospiraceae bacterium]
MDRKVYSVSRIIEYLRAMVREDLFCRHTIVRGEISDVRYHSASGHTYFILREGDNQLSCILYAGDARNQSIMPEDGKEMECEGEITFYHKPARFTFRVKKLSLSGEGRIYEQYLKTRREMEEAGMFSEMYKRRIPRLVRRLGVLSSASGDVRRDIESVAKRRNPFIEIILCPVYVQGEKAIPSLLRGMQRILSQQPDAIIIARGGGSDCDMEVFNSRELGEAVFHSPVPVVSAIGHTPYVPILNMVADLAAGTPSEAAEKVTCNIYELMADLEDEKKALSLALRQILATKRGQVSALGLALEKRSPKATVAARRLMLGEAESALSQAMGKKLASVRAVIDPIPEQMERSLTDKVQKSRYDLEKTSRMMQQMMTGRIQGSREEVSRRRVYLQKDFAAVLQRKKHTLGVLCAKLDGASPLKRISAGYAYVETKTGKGAGSVTELSPGDMVTLYLRDGRVMADVKKIEQDEKLFGREETEWKSR